MAFSSQTYVFPNQNLLNQTGSITIQNYGGANSNAAYLGNLKGNTIWTMGAPSVVTNGNIFGTNNAAMPYTLMPTMGMSTCSPVIQVNNCNSNNDLHDTQKFAILSNSFGGAQNMIGLGLQAGGGVLSLLGKAACGLLNGIGSVFGAGEDGGKNWGDSVRSWFSDDDDKAEVSTASERGGITGGAASIGEDSAPARSSAPAQSSAPAVSTAAPASTSATTPASTTTTTPKTTTPTASTPTTDSSTGTTATGDLSTAQTLNTTSLDAAVKEYNEKKKLTSDWDEGTNNSILSRYGNEIKDEYKRLTDVRDKELGKLSELGQKSDEARTAYENTQSEVAEAVMKAMEEKDAKEAELAQNTEALSEAKTTQKQKDTELKDAEQAESQAATAYENAKSAADTAETSAANAEQAASAAEASGAKNASELRSNATKLRNEANAAKQKAEELKTKWTEATDKVNKLTTEKAQADEKVNKLEGERKTLQTAVDNAKKAVDDARGEQDKANDAAYKAMMDAEEAYRNQENVVADYDGQLKAIKNKIPEEIKGKLNSDEKQPATT